MRFSRLRIDHRNTYDQFYGFYFNASVLVRDGGSCSFLGRKHRLGSSVYSLFCLYLCIPRLAKAKFTAAHLPSGNDIASTDLHRASVKAAPSLSSERQDLCLS